MYAPESVGGYAGMTDPPSPAREAAAVAAVALIEPGMTIGLGSGRAVWRVVELIHERWPEAPPLHAAVASDRTQARAMEAGIELVELNGAVELDLALDGADEVDSQLRLIKGGGGALLREKIVAAAARRFVVVAESAKRVDRLGRSFRLPVEVVQFAWPQTRRRVGELLPEPDLRVEDGVPYETDEGHFILDCSLPEGIDVNGLDVALQRIPGVVEHGLFIGLAELALLGTPDGGVDELRSV